MSVTAPEPEPPPGKTATEPRPSGARFVALGVLSSRVFGLVREKFIAHFLGIAAHADVWRAAMRTPNLLQNLLGEQALSASFIPIYSRMIEEGRHKDAGRFAGAVLCLLTVVVGVVVLLGFWLAPVLVRVLVAGFAGDAAQVATGAAEVDRYVLAVRAVRIVFPMTGFLVLAAWALGVLNSHRRFTLPYMAPIAWNLAIIGALILAAAGGGMMLTPQQADLATTDHWLYAACWGATLGGLLQFLVQLPVVLRCMPELRLSLSTRVAGVREALANLGPVLAGRGVVQLSAFVDNFLASFLHVGAIGALGFAVTLFNLPLGAFGVSIAAAELPELSRAAPGEIEERIATRIRRAIAQSSFLLVPSVVGYLLFGWLVVGLIFRGGSFTDEGQGLVALALAGYGVGLLASAISRLLQNTFFALRDTRTPAKVATARLAISAIFGVGLMLWLDRYEVAALLPTGGPGGGLRLGAMGLALASSLGAWAELLLLRYLLMRRIPGLRLGGRAVLARFLPALLVALPAGALWWWLARAPFILQAMVVLGVYAGLYLAWAWWRRAPELEMWTGRFLRRR